MAKRLRGAVVVLAVVTGLWVGAGCGGGGTPAGLSTQAASGAESSSARAPDADGGAAR